MENIIELKDVCVRYKHIKGTGLKEYIFKNIGRRRSRTKITEALKGITFEIEKGLTVGIVGSNGSGKSTLLRVLGQIYSADSGTVKINTNSIALLTLGTGFKKELTGFENIYINGYLMGLSKDEIDSKVKDIIEFSEIGEFINQPIQTYSSGMKSRLGFAIASHIEPDLLLIDETFSVGDAKFKKKSSEKVKELISGNRTTIIVSHSLGLLKELCQKVIWIEKGELRRYGDTVDVIDEYTEYMTNI